MLNKFLSTTPVCLFRECKKRGYHHRNVTIEVCANYREGLVDYYIDYTRNKHASIRLFTYVVQAKNNIVPGLIIS
jgi:hypothetical protein